MLRDHLQSAHVSGGLLGRPQYHGRPLLAAVRLHTSLKPGTTGRKLHSVTCSVDPEEKAATTWRNVVVVRLVMRVA